MTDAAPDPMLAPTVAGLDARPRAAVERLAGLGFRRGQLSAIQLQPRELDRSARRDLRALLRRLELRAAGLDLWIPERHLLDPVRMDRAVSAMVAAIGLASDLGRCPVSVVLPADEQANQPLAQIVEHALRHGVTLADHAVPATTRNDVGVGIDPARWLAEGRDPLEAVEAAAERLAVARWCDLTISGMRCPPGMGEGRLDGLQYRAALTAAGYRGAVVVDTSGWPDPAAQLPAAADAWADARPPAAGPGVAI